jgi:hypothetical protein
MNLNYIRFKYNPQQNKTLCNLSMIESDQFICESDENWETRRKFYVKQHERNILTMNEYDDYFSKNWFEEFKCQNETRIGTGDGGKWVRFLIYI